MSDDIPMGRYGSGSAYPSDKKYADGEYLDNNNGKGGVSGLTNICTQYNHIANTSSRSMSQLARCSTMVPSHRKTDAARSSFRMTSKSPRKISKK